MDTQSLHNYIYAMHSILCQVTSGLNLFTAFGSNLPKYSFKEVVFPRAHDYSPQGKDGVYYSAALNVHTLFSCHVTLNQQMYIELGFLINAHLLVLGLVFHMALTKRKL